MRILFTSTIALLIGLTFSMQADAKMNIKQKKAYKYATKKIKEYQDGYLKKACGVDIPIEIDKKFVPVFMEKNMSIYGYCEGAVDPIRTFCNDADVKPEIVKNIKKVKCVLGAEGSFAAAKKGTTLELTYGPGTSNLGKKSREWIENNL